VDIVHRGPDLLEGFRTITGMVGLHAEQGERLAIDYQRMALATKTTEIFHETRSVIFLD